VKGILKRNASNTGMLIRLAFSCAWTYRVTDFNGGCNGARIRFSPEKDWSINEGLDKALSLLQPIKEEFNDSLSWADLIVFAGTVALDEAGAKNQSFCGGRVDALSGVASTYLKPRINGQTESIPLFKDFWMVMGLSKRETVALSQISPTRPGETSSLSSAYFQDVMLQANPFIASNGKKMYRSANGKELVGTDLILKWDPEYEALAQEYMASPDLLLDDISTAWAKLMTADMFGHDPMTCKALSFQGCSQGPLATGRLNR